MRSTKQNKIENDIRDGFTHEHIAKKYGVNLKWLIEWCRSNNADRKMDKIMNQLRLSPSAESFSHADSSASENHDARAPPV
jgi:hypothetical protein